MAFDPDVDPILKKKKRGVSDTKDLKHLLPLQSSEAHWMLGQGLCHIYWWESNCTKEVSLLAVSSVFSKQAQVKLLALTLLKFYPRDKQQTYRTQYQSPKIIRTNTKP